MENLLLAFHKEVFRFIYFLFVFIPQKIGLLVSTCYLLVGTTLNFLFFIDKPFLKMGVIARELVEEDAPSKKARK